MADNIKLADQGGSFQITEAEWVRKITPVQVRHIDAGPDAWVKVDMVRDPHRQNELRNIETVVFPANNTDEKKTVTQFLCKLNDIIVVMRLRAPVVLYPTEAMQVREGNLHLIVEASDHRLATTPRTLRKVAWA